MFTSSVKAEVPLGHYIPSLMHNNLSYAGGDRVVWVSGVALLAMGTETRSVSEVSVGATSSGVVHSMRVATLPAANSHFSLVTSKEESRLFFDNICLGTISHTATPTVGHGTCGTVSVSPSTVPLQVHVMCGTSGGVVQFFSKSLTSLPPPKLSGGVSSSSSLSASLHPGEALVPLSSISAHQSHAVTAMDLYAAPQPGQTLLAASGDSSGAVVLWSADRVPYAVIPTADATDCVTAVRLICQGTYVAVAYGCGKVRLYTSAGELKVELCAHSRWINAMDYCNDRALLATASEDGTVQVFYIVKAPSLVVQRCCQIDSLPGVPTGVCFGDRGASVAVACYDSTILRTFTLA